MPILPPEEERQRLAAVYRSMSDGELENIAQDSPDLTDAALQALNDEMQRRGLDFHPGYEQIEHRKLVTVRHFRDVTEGELAKGLLESAGVECFLTDDNTVRMNWFISNYIGGLRLQVTPDNVDAANDVLSQPIPEAFEVEGNGTVQQPRCPKCQSLDITFEPIHKGIALTAAYVASVPLRLSKNIWKCNSCEARWQGLFESQNESQE